MTIIDGIIQGVIQGITEFLPVSSSGHLSIFQHITGQTGDSGIAFSLILHLGTLLAIFISFNKIIFDLVKEVLVILKEVITFKFSLKNINSNRNMVYMLFVALIPMLFFYIFKDIYVLVGIDNDIILEGIFFILTSFMLFIADRSIKGHKLEGDITYKNALLVGVFQGLAPFPGISRSGSTISAGLISGMTKETAVKFSFILGIPVILAGSLVELSGIGKENISIELHILIIGFIVSAIVGVLSIKLVSYLIKSNRFKIFIYYTFILGIIVISIGVFELISGIYLYDLF
ncbi:MAG: undecaprenyl-diphosphate phosphatase [Oscillospiraceae bacterium]|nr:undecaprenyl-diphosphate phosphatase [Oscillospiraceae bacterium]